MVAVVLAKCSSAIFVKLVYATVLKWKSYSRAQETLLAGSVVESIGALLVPSSSLPLLLLPFSPCPPHGDWALRSEWRRPTGSSSSATPSPTSRPPGRASPSPSWRTSSPSTTASSTTSTRCTTFSSLSSFPDPLLHLQYHLPPVRRIPPLLWTRIRADLPSYLSERDSDGVIVIGWYHGFAVRPLKGING